MAQIFHRSMNSVAKMSIVSGILLVASIAVALVLTLHSPTVTGVTIPQPQPVQFSHEHHVSGLGLDCRYCHTSVETSSFAGIPPTSTCLNCHSQIWYTSQMLEPVRSSYKTGKPLEWTRVHNIADFAYFNHSIHVQKGIGCVSCHGRIDKMQLTYKAEPMNMAWCLKCHKNPEKFIRPKDKVFDMAWKAPDIEGTHQAPSHAEHSEKESKEPGEPLESNEKDFIGMQNQIALGKKLVKEYKIPSTRLLTSCSTCHR